MRPKGSVGSRGVGSVSQVRRRLIWTEGLGYRRSGTLDAWVNKRQKGKCCPRHRCRTRRLPACASNRTCASDTGMRECGLCWSFQGGRGTAPRPKRQVPWPAKRNNEPRDWSTSARGRLVPLATSAAPYRAHRPRPRLLRLDIIWRFRRASISDTLSRARFALTHVNSPA